MAATVRYVRERDKRAHAADASRAGRRPVYEIGISVTVRLVSISTLKTDRDVRPATIGVPPRPSLAAT